MVAPGLDMMTAALSVARGEHSKWREHAERTLQFHRGKSAEKVLLWACENTRLLADAGGFSWETLTSESMPFYVALYEWARDGYPHFSLTPDFFSAVAVTDFGDATDEPLYMPFNSFTLSFPKSDLFNQASRVFIYRVASVKFDGGEYASWWKHHRATLITDDPIFTQWPIGFTRRQLVSEETRLNAPVEGDASARKVTPEEAPLLSRLRTLLANVMSYVEASGPLPSKAREKKAAPAAVERVVRDRPVFDVGRVVRLDGGLRKAMQVGEGNRESWRLAQRFIVRGHWRNQAHGEGRALRRRQWIAPFWKGPDNVVEALSRTYEVT